MDNAECALHAWDLISRFFSRDTKLVADLRTVPGRRNLDDLRTFRGLTPLDLEEAHVKKTLFVSVAAVALLGAAQIAMAQGSPSGGKADTRSIQLSSFP